MTSYKTITELVDPKETFRLEIIPDPSDALINHLYCQGVDVYGIGVVITTSPDVLVAYADAVSGWTLVSTARNTFGRFFDCDGDCAWHKVKFGDEFFAVGVTYRD